MSGDKLTVTEADRDAEAAFDKHVVETWGWTKFASMQTAASGAEYGRAFKAGYLAARPTELVEALRGVVSHFPGEQGPGHSHRVPGIWDEDNHPALAGTKCEWCAHWEKVKALTLHDREERDQ